MVFSHFPALELLQNSDREENVFRKQTCRDYDGPICHCGHDRIYPLDDETVWMGGRNA